MCEVYKVAIVCLTLVLLIGAIEIWWMCSSLNVDDTPNNEKDTD
jgi:hypothetical protein